MPAAQAATAQSLHAALGVGAISTMLMLLSGPLFATFGDRSFWAMAAVCAVALPPALGLRLPREA